MNRKNGRRSFFDLILDLGSGLAALIIIFMMLAVIYEVVMRYFLNHPTLWVLEVVEWCLVWMTFLCAAWVLREEAHVKMDIFVTRLNPKTQILFSFITSIVGALICLTFVWYGTQVVWDHFVRGVVEAKMLRAPKAPLMVIIPAGFFLLFIQFIRRSFSFLRKWRTSR
jgi:TRAP-type C4-dicarboxylate transport system permease small subunit